VTSGPGYPDTRIDRRLTHLTANVESRLYLALWGGASGIVEQHCGRGRRMVGSFNLVPARMVKFASDLTGGARDRAHIALLQL